MRPPYIGIKVGGETYLFFLPFGRMNRERLFVYGKPRDSRVVQERLTDRNREFWCKGNYVDTVGKNTAAIKEYRSGTRVE